MQRPDPPAACALDRLREWSQDELHITRSVRMHEPIYANPAALRADVRIVVEREVEAKELLDMAWQAIAFAPQPDDAKAVSENRLLERIEVWLRG